jgi:hypothetical protein
MVKKSTTLLLNVSPLVNLTSGRLVQAPQFMGRILAWDVALPLVAPSKRLHRRLCSIWNPSLQIILYIL